MWGRGRGTDRGSGAGQRGDTWALGTLGPGAQVHISWGIGVVGTIPTKIQQVHISRYRGVGDNTNQDPASDISWGPGVGGDN